MSDPAALSVRGLTVSFGSVQVCRDVDLELADGAVGALVGTNGAGKSTILRALAGAIPARGSVRLFGEELAGLPAVVRARRGLVLAAGGRGTFPSLTVEEAVAVGAGRRRGVKSAAAAVEEAVTLFPTLAPHRRQRCGSLSSGEQQLVTLARAVVAHPRVLLVDELTLGLSGAAAADVRCVVARRGNVVLVDQSIVGALRVSTWAWFLERGALRWSGPAGELPAQPDLLQPVLLG